MRLANQAKLDAVTSKYLKMFGFDPNQPYRCLTHGMTKVTEFHASIDVGEIGFELGTISISPRRTFTFTLECGCKVTVNN